MKTFALAAACGAIALAAAAHGAFTGVAVREMTGLPAAAVPGDVRVLRFYAQFDGPGDATTDEGRENVLIAALTPPEPDGAAPLHFGLDLARQPGANFYNAPAIAGAGNGAPNLAFGDNRALYDTYFSIGLESVNSSDGPAFDDATIYTAGFGLTDSDGVAAAGQAGDRLEGVGGVLWGAPLFTLQGVPEFNAATGRWETFFAQLSVVGAAPVAAVGSLGALTPTGGEVASVSEFTGDLFSGVLRLAVGSSTQGAAFHEIRFVPGPGGAALGLLAMALRRRR